MSKWLSAQIIFYVGIVFGAALMHITMPVGCVIGLGFLAGFVLLIIVHYTKTVDIE